MLKRKLLVLFGGTDQSEPESIFLKRGDLLEFNTDVLQFNLLTNTPSVRFESQVEECKDLNGTWIEGDGVTVPSRFQSDERFTSFRLALDEVKDDIEKIDWSGSSSIFKENAPVRGMNKKALEYFSESPYQLVYHFWKIIGEYEKLVVMAHSRGCALATECLNYLTEHDRLD